MILLAHSHTYVLTQLFTHLLIWHSLMPCTQTFTHLITHSFSRPFHRIIGCSFAESVIRWPSRLFSSSLAVHSFIYLFNGSFIHTLLFTCSLIRPHVHSLANLMICLLTRLLTHWLNPLLTCSFTDTRPFTRSLSPSSLVHSVVQ